MSVRPTPYNDLDETTMKHYESIDKLDEYLNILRPRFFPKEAALEKQQRSQGTGRRDLGRSGKFKERSDKERSDKERSDTKIRHSIKEVTSSEDSDSETEAKLKTIKPGARPIPAVGKTEMIEVDVVQGNPTQSVVALSPKADTILKELDTILSPSHRIQGQLLLTKVTENVVLCRLHLVFPLSVPADWKTPFISLGLLVPGTLCPSTVVTVNTFLLGDTKLLAASLVVSVAGEMTIHVKALPVGVSLFASDIVTCWSL